MGRRKRAKDDVLETFRFTVDDWFREYRFGINRHPWEFSPDHYDEHNQIKVVGKLRNKTRRKIDRGELHLLASTVPRGKWGDDAKQIGNAWITEGVLNCSAWIPADVLHSLVPVFAANKFKEMVFTVCNLRYNKGAMEFLNLDYELTPLDEDE